MSDNKGVVLSVSDSWSRVCYVPMIRLKGQWLARVGFKRGDKVEVLYSFESDSLIIKKKCND